MLIGGELQLILKNHYKRILEAEVASVKAAYKAETKDLKKQNLTLLDEVTQPKSMDKPLTETELLNLSASKLIAEHGYGGGVIEEEAPRFKMYDRTTDNFNPADEERSEEEPYVVSIAEWSNDEEDFDKITVRYFEEDTTLVEELRSETLPLESVGESNLLRFGVGSQDESIVYVRNEMLKIDFEVIRDEGSYTATVLGIPEWNSRDVKDKPRVKKMRTAVTDNERTLDDLYFDWLYKKIGVLQNRNPNKSYWKLARYLYRTPFFWVVPE
jgi:hypothetical protein